MAIEHVTAKDSRYYIVSITPDVCFTPIGDESIPLPYFLFHTMDQSDQCSPDVFIRGKPAFLHKWSFVDNAQGDEPGVDGGIITGVNMRVTHSKQYSDSVYINNKNIVRTADIVYMNTKRP